jgi:tetratricopeptide (TPR) repeat protein
LSYPGLSAPFVNLGILYRKSGRLDQSEEALKSAVERNGASAVAWNELGATQRMRGEFPDAAASYERAIAADSNFAPAYRNLGVVSDLYLGDPERALTSLERYKELTGEDRPVTSWIAELRQRTGKPPVKPAGAAPAPAGASPAAAPDAPPPNSAAPGTSSDPGKSGDPGKNGDPGKSPNDAGKSPDRAPTTKPAPKAGD